MCGTTAAVREHTETVVEVEPGNVMYRDTLNCIVLTSIAPCRIALVSPRSYLGALLTVYTRASIAILNVRSCRAGIPLGSASVHRFM